MVSRRPTKCQNLIYDPNSTKTEKYLLDATWFCEAHESKEHDGIVCEINNPTYYAKHPSISDIFPTLQAREKELGVTELWR